MTTHTLIRRAPRALVLLLLLVALVTAAALLAPPTTGTIAKASADPGCADPLPREGGGYWTCTFADEFSGDTLDRSKWSALTSLRTGTGHPYECRVDDPDNIAVSEGTLRLTVRREGGSLLCRGILTAWSTPHTAGAVSTLGKFSQTYGRFAVRAKFPAAKVKGLHSALWLWPQEMKYGRASGEIDIAEFRTVEPDKAVPYVHYLETIPDVERTSYSCFVDRPEDFHEYVVEWTPTSITFLYDGQLCLRNTGWRPLWPWRSPAPFDRPFAINLNQSLGWNYNAFERNVTPLPATMEVDYVRVWQ